MIVEEHPLEPFLPGNARVLFLGSFPPPRARWSMEFFYPNWINDFWRIQGLIHFGDARYFEAKGVDCCQAGDRGAGALDTVTGRGAEPGYKPCRRFDRDRIVEFCRNEGLAFFDTARKVCRMKGNADDNFLEVVERTDVFALLRQMPLCRTIVTTGGKASEELQAYFAEQGLTVAVPKVGERAALEVTAGMVAGGLNTTAAVAVSGLVVHAESVPSAEPLTLSWWRMPSTSRAYPMKMERKAEFYRRLVMKVDTI